ncbi:MAG: SRPBCC family protein [Pseudonocardiales bacterium]
MGAAARSRSFAEEVMMARRATVVSSVHVDRSAAEVFDYLADVARHAEWSPKPYRVEGITAGEQVVNGSRFTSIGWLPNDKTHRNEVEATEVQAPTRLVLTSTDSGQQFISTFRLTPAGSGTDIERVMDMPRPGGLAGALFPLISAVLIKPDVKKGLGKLKTTLETRG